MGVPHTNVGHEQFPNDGYGATDITRDVLGFAANNRNVVEDLAGPGALIASGLTGAAGTTAGKIKVLAGRARDLDKYEVYLEANADNQTPAAVAPAYNYVHLKRTTVESGTDGAYDTEIEYPRVITEGSEVIITTGEQLEANGYIRLFKCKYETGVWTFDYSYRSKDLQSIASPGAKVYVNALALPGTGAWVELPGQDFATGFTWLGQSVLLEIADGYLTGGAVVRATDIDGVLYVAALDAVYTIGSVSDDAGAPATLQLRVPSAKPSKVEMKTSMGAATIYGRLTTLGRRTA
jgi:hypothetical protein